MVELTMTYYPSKLEVNQSIHSPGEVNWLSHCINKLEAFLTLDQICKLAHYHTYEYKNQTSLPTMVELIMFYYPDKFEVDQSMHTELIANFIIWPKYANELIIIIMNVQIRHNFSQW